MFTVIALDTKQPVHGPEGVLCFDNGTDAAAVAKTYTENTGRKYQPRPIVENDCWKERERNRFLDGTYQFLPWVHEPWWQGSIGEIEHFAHISQDKSGMLAYTECAAKGVVDRQTRVRPGVYLTCYFSDVLSSEKIRDLATDYLKRFKNHEIQFAITADEIEEVYLNGPDSCMSNNLYRRKQDWGKFKTPFHPCRVYAAGDLAIAYLKKDKRITARSLVWPARKTFGRIYGDATRLKDLLVTAGYECADPIGARLTAHAVNNGFVCPYLDKGGSSGQGNLLVRLDETKRFLIIDYCGDYDCASLTGLTQHGHYTGQLYDDETDSDYDDDSDCDDDSDYDDDDDDDSGEWCPSCEESGFNPDHMYYIEDARQSWCESCSDAAYICEATGNRYAQQRNVVRMANGDYWSYDYFESHGLICEGTGDYHRQHDCISLHDGTVWCDDYFSDNGFTCRHCDERFRNDEMSEHDEDSCEGCAETVAPEYDSNGHVVIQGRDEWPNQLELPLTEIAGPFLPWPRQWRLGDMVKMQPNAVYLANHYGPITQIGHCPTMLTIKLSRRLWVYDNEIDYINPVNMNAEGI